MDEKASRYIILASTSPRRQELIAALRIPFEIMPSDANEDTPAGWGPSMIVENLALRKADAVYRKMSDSRSNAIIVGSDTIVVLESDILGKPVDDNDAVRMISSLQGRTHKVFTGVACVDALTGERIVRHRMTSVRMKPLNMDQVMSYVRSGEPNDKAGAYAIQGLGASIIEGIEGDYFNVVGLPISLLSDMLSEMGMHVLS
ncbi:Maf family protein [Paenibacillus dakarensis]|uniref:Maf family protein n=1 Tax=Paenibacillus dakarensis TaxID=1527293 RepID=UPI0006D55710|nr:Maf family protein [Paenibacillus dakarensis]